MYNKYDAISAYAGLEGSLYLTGNYRSQWINLDGQPIAQRVNAHLPLYFLQGAGGIRITNDKQGPQSITQVDLSYNYVMSRSWGIFSAGASLGIFQYRLDGRQLRTPEGHYSDNNFLHNDFQLDESLNNAIGANYGLSVYFINDFLEAGIAFDQFPSFSTKLIEGKFRFAGLIKGYCEVPFIINEKYKLTPSLLIQSDLKQLQTDISATVEYSGNIFGGLGMRGYSANSFDAVLIIAGWKFDNQYKLSYAYDLGISSIRSVNQGTHEIQLNYNLNKKIGAGLPPKIIFNPRYM